MKTSLLQSRFRGVYLGLIAMWLAVSLTLGILIDSWVAPSLLRSRVQNVETLVKSHQNALQLYDHRALRDTLLESHVIGQDQDFEELRPSKDTDRAQLSEFLKSCQFVTEQSCVGRGHALIFSQAGHNTAMQSSFVVSLKTTALSQIPGIWLWKLFSALALGILMALVIWAVRVQEKFLLEKIGLLVQSFVRVESLFQMHKVENSGSPPAPKPDEFLTLSQGIEQMGILLQAKAKQIEEYKRQFERKTRMEQLAQTIAYTSHELKAPLHEGADFLRDLPEFLKSMPRDSIERSAKSLEKRLRDGAISMQEALSATEAAQSRSETLNLAGVLRGFVARISENPELKSTQIRLNIATMENALVHCDVADLEAALFNLYRNSREAKRDARILIEGMASNSQARIQFSDDGPGIPDEFRSRIFDEFFTTKSSGSGLGLAIVREAVLRAGGEIQALPSDQGARFEITLPVVGLRRDTNHVLPQEGVLHV